ncbi:hypothetical protein SAMN05421810_101366 [Amycolatopsis arida]|uniref:Uncharacterized protein n=1 Tax=Amycolatopsis arida TaxID=587909 RepID=A0A1I5L188_9PSEU|nr:hypothetical protein [Amycolatopsis arida]TDX85910.1 hypothetical protein CLV69_11491 [Amycolatopsis arida]SFO91090.1 hypothetical protein SAMN05421810_101366 [Amycolatopsis arida]
MRRRRLAATILVIGLFLADPEKTFWLYYWLVVVVFFVLTWLAIGPIKSTIKPKQPPKESTPETSRG